ncbi:uncharacterized protein LOC129959471 [Argiope bruennichi]|uniref:uncharacterized protein LOC129959471 n=1 Tax=Argiope bruennichi TaxID=94029 RepID=UPI00249422B1|nr:uncharacterized protein LOC129959471 [Argiope bruennichi]
MNVIAKRCLLLVIITFQCEYRITLAQEATNETDTSREENSSSFENSFIESSSFINIYEASSLNVSDIIETPHLPKTITSSPYLFTSISQNLRDDVSTHFTENFINEDSSIALESSLQDADIFLSSSADSLLNYYGDFEAMIESAVEISPTAERRIYIPSSLTNSPQLESFSSNFDTKEYDTEDSFSDFHFIEVTPVTPTAVYSEVEVSTSLPLDETSSSIYSSQLLPSSTSSYVSNILIEIKESSTAGSSKLSQYVSSPVLKNEKEFFTESIGSSNNTENDPSNDSLEVAGSEILRESNVSHEIINDDLEIKNKTSRNEDPQLDDIISGIVHLLAGKVQLGRPVFAPPPKRQNRPPAHSTRINNRGPLSSSSTPYSRTIVVFSQPQNPSISVTEMHRPMQFPPSGAVGGILPHPSDKPEHALKIRPTRVNDRPLASAPGNHFQHFGGKVPANGYNQPPFTGEVFSQDGAPLRPKLQLANVPDGVILNTFPENSKPQNQKDISTTKRTHFIFSDSFDSTQDFHTRPLPSNVQTTKTFATIINPQLNSANKLSSTNTFEVFTDQTNSQEILKKTVKASTGSSSVAVPTESFPRDSIKPTKVHKNFVTVDNQTVPFGPITDWVPVIERPSMRFKPVSSNLNKTRADSDVSIIMQPIIFDITVSQSYNDPNISANKTTEASSSSIFNSTNIRTYLTEIVDTSSTFNTKLEILTSEVLESQNDYTSSSISTPVLIDSRIPVLIDSRVVTTPAPDTKISKIATAWEDIRTVLKEESQNRPKLSETVYSAPKPTIPSVQYNVISSRVEEKRTQQKSYATSPSLNSPSSKTFGTLFSAPSNNNPNLGRPFVKPVEIEEVRPYVGAINPVDQDRTRPAYPPFRGAYPSGTVQVTRAGVNVREESTSLPNNPLFTSRTPIIRSPPRPRPNTIRIDTCIVGDDSTCDSKSNETCKTEQGISSCHCKPGYARSYTRGPCVPVVSLMLALKVDRMGNRKLSFTPKYLDKNSEEYRILEFEAKQALSTLFTHTAFSRTFLGSNVNTFYSIGGKLIINATVFLEEKESTRAQSVRLRLRQEIAESIKNRNRNIGESRLYADGPLSPLQHIDDVNECSDINLNDCAGDGACLNVFGTFICRCKPGYIDPFKHDERRSGRKCLACQPDYCSYHGQCFVVQDQKLCNCTGNFIGRRCELDGEIVAVSVGAVFAAIIIIVVTLYCLCSWNRKWKKQQQKAEVLSSRSYNSNNTFSCISNMMNANINPYNLTMEDRMRWAHISDVVKSVSMPTSDYPYASTSLEQPGYPNRFQQHLSDEEASWYDYRTRPRSRALPPPRTSPNATYYEMDSAPRGAYMSSSGHSSKRIPKKLTRY